MARAVVYGLADSARSGRCRGRAARAAVQPGAVAATLTAATVRAWLSILVLTVMFGVAVVTAARRSQADHGSLWLAASLALDSS